MREEYEIATEAFRSFKARMDLTAHDKARMLAYVRPGRIIELGCGNGTVLSLIAERFPAAEIVGVDYDEDNLAAAADRLCGDRVQLVRLDLRNLRDLDEWQEKFDTVVLSSVLHEVESRYGLDTSCMVIQETRRLLSEGGMFLFRDGVKPETRDAVLRFKTPYARSKFERFVGEYYREIKFSLSGDDGSAIRISAFDLHDFACKYYFEGELWDRDMMESFGSRTLRQYLELVKGSFRVEHIEAYTLPLLTELWRRDFDIDQFETLKSHVLIAARKQDSDRGMR